MRTQSLQEAGHGETFDYRDGSPHLKHWRLHERLITIVRNELKQLHSQELPLTVLEVGAGHGGYTEALLAMGCSVTATEMSRPSLDRLRDRYAMNNRLSTIFDQTGTGSVVGDRQFSLIICASVLHHIPDYLTMLQGSLLPLLVKGGTFVSLQDPLFYESMKRVDFAMNRVAYLSWRCTKGQYMQGLATGLRRVRGIYDPENPHDMVEYHVVRRGIDHDALLTLLAEQFQTANLVPYWSTQSPFWQRLGEHLRRQNTFASVARSYQGASD